VSVNFCKFMFCNILKLKEINWHGSKQKNKRHELKLHVTYSTFYILQFGSESEYEKIWICIDALYFFYNMGNYNFSML
jgi:hypothetical protein